MMEKIFNSGLTVVSGLSIHFFQNRDMGISGVVVGFSFVGPFLIFPTIAVVSAIHG